MSNYKFLLLSFLVFFKTQAQHLYPEKFDNCNITSFCLDCGNPQAEQPENIVNDIIAGINKKTFAKLTGTIEVQILIDENGMPCLLSAHNKTGVSTKKLNLQEAINKTSVWTPAVSEGKKKSSSVSYLLEFDNGRLSIKRKIFNFKNQSNMSSAGTPDVKGTNSDKLTNTWTLYNQQNSELPWDMTRAVVVDKDNTTWIGTDNGIVAIKDNKWIHYNSKNSIISAPQYNRNETQSVRYAAVDKQNNKWFIAGWDAYRFDNTKWTKFDSLNSPINWARKIFVDNSNNIWFTSWDGVAKFDGSSWKTYTMANAQLPDDKTLGVFVDSKNKIWIGTFEGNVVIENGKTKGLNDNKTPLSKAYISQMYEDKKGNLWFDLYNDKSPGDRGIYILDTFNKWTKLEFPKGVLEDSAINNFFLDENNNKLWVTVNGVGVLLYDLNLKKWEIYTNVNSNVPSIHAEQITQDKNGNIWIATYAGAIKTN
jgi:ligand-binding sensor domain-containing protein